MGLLDGPRSPELITAAAQRLVVAWEAMRVGSGRPSDSALVEMHRAVLELIAVTGTKDLQSAIDAVGDVDS